MNISSYPKSLCGQRFPRFPMPVERSTRLKQTTLDGKQAQAKVHSSTKSRKERVSDTSNERVFTDVLLTIKPEFAKMILKREKNYEFRNYQLRPTVERLWLYESAPTSAITYVYSFLHSSVYANHFTVDT
jgi:hypothetical protein